jgi:hypothetical protein
MSRVLVNWNPSVFHFILFALGGGFLYLGEEWGIGWAGPIGMGCMGLFLVAMGVDVIVKRLGIFHIDGWTQAKVVDTYRGLGELLWGFLFVLLGLVVAGIVLMNWFWPAASGTIWSALLNTAPGLGSILALAGLMMLLSGLVRALAGTGRVDPARLSGLPYALDRLVGAGTFLVGALIAASGLLLLIAPDVAAAGLDRVTSLW